MLDSRRHSRSRWGTGLQSSEIKRPRSADMQMPGLSGADLQNRLISQGRCMPTIFVTAFPDEKIRARVLTAGAIGYLSKPFTEESLISCLDTALSNDNAEGVRQ